LIVNIANHQQKIAGQISSYIEHDNEEGVKDDLEFSKKLRMSIYLLGRVLDSLKTVQIAQLLLTKKLDQ